MLTLPLTARRGRVVAFEIDRDLAATLRDHAPPHLAIVEGDFLDVTADAMRDLLADSASTPRVVGNLPYNVASPMLFKLLDLYATGIALGGSISQSGVLTATATQNVVSGLSTSFAGANANAIGIGSFVSCATANVGSAVVHAISFPDPPTDPAVFAAIVQAIFTRRKTLHDALLPYLWPGRQEGGRQSVVRRSAPGRSGRPAATRALAIPELVRLADVFSSVSPRAVL